MNPRKPLFLLLFLCMLFTGYSAYAFPCKVSAASNTSSARLRDTLYQKNGKWYYYDSNGHIVKKTWKTIDGKCYYFSMDGSAFSGLHNVNGKRYLFRKDGSARSGWCSTRSGELRYFSPKTYVMVTGWKKIGGNTYYFSKDGIMQHDTWINGKYFGSDGILQPNKKMTLYSLKKKLQNAIKSYRGTWSVYVKNLDTGEYFTINNQKIYAASVIKLYAMAATYDKIEQKALSESSVSSLLKSMITVSSNDAFNSIVKKIGTSYINTWCKKNGYLSTNQGHGLSPSGNNTGLRNGTGSNVTTVADCGKLLESIYRGTCVSKKASAKMLSLLKQQQRRSKIPAGVPSGVTVANKTGETDNTTHDVAIVYSKGATYILCVMGNVPGGAWSASSNITKISSITYNYFN